MRGKKIVSSDNFTDTVVGICGSAEEGLEELRSCPCTSPWSSHSVFLMVMNCSTVVLPAMPHNDGLTLSSVTTSIRAVTSRFL